MDCLQAQQLISAALDRESVAPEQLAEAKQHCRECAECARFVRGLAAVQRAGAPKPPAGLAQRAAANAVEVVRREDSEAAAEPAAALGVAASASAVASSAIADAGDDLETPASDTAVPPSELASVPTAYDAPAAPPRHLPRQMWIAWGAAAAALLLFAGVAAIWGARAIYMSSTGAGVAEVSSNETAMAPPPAQDMAASGSAAPSEAQKSAPTTGASSSYVVLGGSVYRFKGASAESTSGLSPVGTVNSAFDTGQAATDHTAFKAPGTDDIIVEGPEGGLKFGLVTTTYAGRTYVLRSGPITAFGVWPTLPSEITPPARSDGSPTFVRDSGSVYRLTTGTSAEGIALAPGAAQSGGNPNWTWWTPQP